ncbi:MAG: hypothetical protein KA118_00285 [Verrucomicrobia bacterium]|nr:hypothetical protein [Verrucomicrobiota bacterium]
MRNVIICECAHGARIAREKLRTLRASLKGAGIACAAVPDLCGMAARKDPLLARLASDPSARICACYPRAIRALFEFAGAPLAAPDVQPVDLREAPIEAVLAGLGIRACLDNGLEDDPSAAPADDGWIPWFPVIDSQRCSQCQQCLGFCLFGVYALAADGKVVVQQPMACKTYCPACARICPQAAIVFPKHEGGSIAGAEIADEEKEKNRIQSDRAKVLGSDVYRGLAERRQQARGRQLLRPEVDLARDPSEPIPERPGSTQEGIEPASAATPGSDPSAAASSIRP